MQEEGKEKVFYEQVRDEGADVNSLYTKLSSDYDSIIESFGGVMCIELTKLLESHFTDVEKRASLKIYEIGVGTGKLGELLVKAGFSNIYGFEPCQAMIKLAQEKGIYKELKVRYSGTGELETEFKGKFDIAVGSGVFVKNHVPPEGFDELLESLQKGGVAVFPVREDQWVGLGYKEKAESLQKEGKWKLLQRAVKQQWKKSQVQKNYVYSLYEKQ